MGFFGWCRRQRKRRDRIGDIARDICDDWNKKPRGPSSIKKWREYIDRHVPSYDAVMAFKAAWKAYTQQKKRGSNGG